MDVIQGFFEADAARVQRTLNGWPCYRGTGARVARISSDFHDWEIEIPLTDATRNLVGTTYGGSMYAAVDPIIMIAFLKILGPGHTVWDKAAAIRFRRPGRDTLFANIHIDPNEVERVRSLLETEPKFDRPYAFELTDAQGTPHASVNKTIHFRKE